MVFRRFTKTSIEKSLDDCLETATKLQLDISDILLRCIFHKYLFAPDIDKVYQKINTWGRSGIPAHHLRNSLNEEVQEFQSCTILYGRWCERSSVICNTFCGSIKPNSRTVIRILELIGRNILITSTYVNNIIVTRADIIDYILQVKSQVVLRRW